VGQFGSYIVVCRGGTILFHRPSSSQRHGRGTLIESILLNVLRILCLTRSFEIKKSLIVTHDLPNGDDAQKVEEIVFLEVSPILDGERSFSKE